MPEKMKVQATVPEKKDAAGKVVQKQIGPFTIEVSTGKDASECIQLFGGDAVKSNAESNWTITLQSNMRTGMKKGETEAQLQARLGSAKMGVATKAAIIDPEQAFKAKFLSATPAERDKLIADLKAMAAQK